MELLRTLEEKVDPSCAAVMVIDMQNDFCAEGGFLDHLGVDLGPIQAIVPTIRRLLDSAREHGVPVLHAYYDGDPRFFLAPMLERLERKNESDAYCMPGSWGNITSVAHWTIAFQTGLLTGLLAVLLTFTPAAKLYGHRYGNALIVGILEKAIEQHEGKPSGKE